MQLEAGQTVEQRYQVVGLLGSGGMAVVYRVIDRRLDVELALKVLSITTPGVTERLLQEGRVQASLRHPNVVPVTDIVSVGGQPGLVMELVEGPSLDDLLAHGPLDLVEAETLARGILAGVRAAHTVGIVHRDLKPGNVLLALHDGLLPKVTDFGLAKALDATGTATRSGAMMGTPQYMAPEQLRDASDVDERADVFAFGCILYELCCGRRPFDQADTLALFDAIRHGTFPAPDTLRADLPPRLAAAIAGCLEPDRDARLASCDAVFAALDVDGGPPTPAWRAETLARASFLGRRSEVPSASPPLETTGGATVDWSIGPADATSEADASAVAAPVATPPASSRTRVAALTLVGVLALGSVGVLGWTLANPSTDTGFSAEGIPDQIDPPEIAALTEEVWELILENRDSNAFVLVEQAIAAGAEDPTLYVLAAQLHLGFEQPGKWQEALEQAEARLDDHTSPALADLVHLQLDNARRDPGMSWWNEAFEAHLTRWPGDPLALLLWTSGIVLFDPSHVEAADRLVETLPDAAVSYVAAGLVRQAAGDVEGAETVLREGLARVPHSAALHTTLSFLPERRGAFAEALALGQRALTLDPSWTVGRYVVARNAIRVGDEKAWAHLASAVHDPALSADERCALSSVIRTALHGQGRLREARAWSDTTLLLSWETRDPERILWELGVRARTHLDVALGLDVERTKVALGQMREILADPDVPGLVRTRWATPMLTLQGLVAAVEGTTDEVDGIAERLAPDAPEAAHAIRTRLAITEGRAEDVLARDDTCTERLTEVSGRVALGAVDLARRSLDRIDDVPACLDAVPVPGRARAQAALAVLAAEEGDPETAEAYLDAFVATWPHADRDLPIVERLAREVSPTLLERLSAP